MRLNIMVRIGGSRIGFERVRIPFYKKRKKDNK